MNSYPSVNPNPTHTRSELIRCPACNHVEWATVENGYLMHECQNCMYLILESEWEPVELKQKEQPK